MEAVRSKLTKALREDVAYHSFSHDGPFLVAIVA